MAEKKVIDYKTAVDAEKTRLSGLHTRMDDDRKLVELKKYALTDVNDKAVPNSISVTLNDPAVFAANVESALGSATEQVVVESENKQLDTAYIEDLVKAAFSSADKRLTRSGRFPLTPFFDQQMCRRGRGAARCCFRIDKKTGQLIADITEWDTRFVYYAMGADGLDWAAYEIDRSRDSILAQYPKADVPEEGATILDIWSKERNEVYLGDTDKIVDIKNPYGYVPVCLQLVPMGSMLADKDSIANQGESIFFLIRDLVPELNRLVSIIQSLNMKALDNALLWPNKDGIQGKVPNYRKLTRPGSITPTDIGGGAEPVAYGELKRSAYLLHSTIEIRIQRGSVSNLDLGIMGNQPWSAVALIEIGEGRDQVFLPRLGARGLLKQQLAEMIIDQIINCGASSVELGARGHKRTFDVRELQGEYDISFKYFIKSPKIDIARFSMAAAAGDLIPKKAKRRDILQRENPEEDERQLRWEEVELLSPAVKMDRDIRNLLEMAKRGDPNAAYEAELLSAEMGVNLEQMLSGNVQQQPKPQEGEKPEPLIPLFGKGGAGSSAQKAAELQAQPRESEGEG